MTTTGDGSTHVYHSEVASSAVTSTVWKKAGSLMVWFSDACLLQGSEFTISFDTAYTTKFVLGDGSIVIPTRTGVTVECEVP